MAIDPDLVILQFHENDLIDLAGTSMWENLARNRETKSRFPMSLVYPVVRRTALWNLVSRAMAIRRRRADVRGGLGPGSSVVPGLGGGDRSVGSGPLIHVSQNPDGPVPQAVHDESLTNEYRDRLAALRDELERRGVDFVVTVFPAFPSVYGQEPSAVLSWMDGLIAELDLRALSFLGPFMADGREGNELYLLPFDAHASAAGYALAADVLADRLVEWTDLAATCR
jgi:hypothetical protein